jgi:hypothetical protein
MRKLSGTLLILAVMALLCGNTAAQAAEAPEVAPSILDQTVTEEPGITNDLITPEPIFVCKTGWCSSNEQCEIWLGPGATCNLEGGQSCGQCIW